MFGRPIPIWIILAFLAYGVFGTASKLASALNGAASYTVFIAGASIAASIVAIFLIVEIWRNGRNMVKFAWAYWGLTVMTYIYWIAAYSPLDNGEISIRAEYVAITIFAVLLCALYAAIPLYLMRNGKHNKAKIIPDI